jgi:hypothetical protein
VLRSRAAHGLDRYPLSDRYRLSNTPAVDSLILIG